MYQVNILWICSWKSRWCSSCNKRSYWHWGPNYSNLFYYFNCV